MGHVLIILSCVVVAGVAAGMHFGWLAGLGVSAAIYALMPWHPKS